MTRNELKKLITDLLDMGLNADEVLYIIQHEEV